MAQCRLRRVAAPVSANAHGDEHHHGPVIPVRDPGHFPSAGVLVPTVCNYLSLQRLVSMAVLSGWHMAVSLRTRAPCARLRLIEW